MTGTPSIRAARAADTPAIDALLARSYPRLLKADYPPSVLVTALPRIARANPALVASGRYYVVEDAAGRLLGAGGWSFAGPGGGGGGAGRPGAVAHVRHVATDPDALRRGVGRALMRHVTGAARAEGVRRLDCLSTRTAVAFYAALGFEALGEVTVALAPGVVFPAVRMRLALA